MIKLNECSVRRADLRRATCVETVDMIRCDFRGARFQGSVWPDSGAVYRSRFKGAFYDGGTHWPRGNTPPDAIHVGKMFAKLAVQRRRELLEQQQRDRGE
jgi:hypothetical protein